ncbi:hypothetical protein D3C79_1104350 [compost metagenome]
MFTDLFNVGFVGRHLGCALRLKQCSNFLVQIPSQCLKLFLAQAAFRFQALPFIRLRQTIPTATE